MRIFSSSSQKKNKNKISSGSGKRRPIKNTTTTTTATTNSTKNDESIAKSLTPQEETRDENAVQRRETMLDEIAQDFQYQGPEGITSRIYSSHSSSSGTYGGTYGSSSCSTSTPTTTGRGNRYPAAATAIQRKVSWNDKLVHTESDTSSRKKNTPSSLTTRGSGGNSYPTTHRDNVIQNNNDRRNNNITTMTGRNNNNNFPSSFNNRDRPQINTNNSSNSSSNRAIADSTRRSGSTGRRRRSGSPGRRRRSGSPSRRKSRSPLRRNGILNNNNNNTMDSMMTTPFGDAFSQALESIITHAPLSCNGSRGFSSRAAVAEAATVPMCLAPCVISGNACVEMMIDTGAQTSVMSLPLAKQLRLDRRIDRSVQGIASGVGRARILGHLIGVVCELGHVEFVMNFAVLDVPDKLLLMGLDLMRKHRCIVDLDKDRLVFGGEGGIYVPFLPPSDSHIALRNQLLEGVTGCNVM